MRPLIETPLAFVEETELARKQHVQTCWNLIQPFFTTLFLTNPVFTRFDLPRAVCVMYRVPPFEGEPIEPEVIVSEPYSTLYQDHIPGYGKVAFETLKEKSFKDAWEKLEHLVKKMEYNFSQSLSPNRHYLFYPIENPKSDHHEIGFITTGEV